ncbi:hypothetical protein M413DRAFT_23206 [Hebeloma cylindrosporum]|uniref:PPPDE domain-containing protein n=1 Tax=Hebeloma cylindrosporum TaxID=76867 RepID=A0A0C3CDM3_HEBCY|nr:hypothetical protein M413DRAFT_23206 [Hebeloma cylindrosporum h7]
MPFKLRLLQFFRPLLRAFGMSDTASNSPESLFFPNLPTNVNGYVLQVSADLKVQKNMFRVKKVFLLKQLSQTSQHEYFTAVVEHPDGRDRFVSFERSGRHPSSEPQPKAPLNGVKKVFSKSDSALAGTTATQNIHSSEPPPQPEPIVVESPDPISPPVPKKRNILHRASASVSSALSVSSSSLSSPSASLSNSNSRNSSGVASLDSCFRAGEALDIVRVHPQLAQHPKDQIMGTLSLESPGLRPVYLHELAVLAQTIHNSNSCYRLFSSNCYWYAGMMMDVLGRRVNSKMVLAPKSWILVLENSHGDWKGLITVYHAAPEGDVIDVLADFEGNLSKFEADIQAYYEEQDKGEQRLKEAEAAKEEAEAAKEEAEAAKEEERRLKEEERRLKEEERRLKEEAEAALKSERLASAAREKELLEQLRLLQAAK